jgi:dihydrofolate reductase
LKYPKLQAVSALPRAHSHIGRTSCVRREWVFVVRRSGDTFVMAELIFSAITSLDGYIEDEAGGFEWAEPDDEVFEFLNELERPVGTYLYGRRMYETLVYWETADFQKQESPVAWDWMQLWRAADKVVYSRSLDSVSSANTRLERNFEPNTVQAMKDSLDRDISIAGPDLAAKAFKAGLVDRCQLFLTPVLVGAGKRALPSDARLDLDLISERRFSGGVVFLDYRVNCHSSSRKCL